MSGAMTIDIGERLDRLERLVAGLVAHTEVFPVAQCHPESVVQAARFLCCETFGVTMGDIASRKRTSRVVWARNVAIHCCIRICALSLNEAARLFDKDHSGIHHARKMVKDRLDTEDLARRQVEVIYKKLVAQFPSYNAPETLNTKE
jgi:chromosomal replication initiation ATPase DnaA